MALFLRSPVGWMSRTHGPRRRDERAVLPWLALPAASLWAILGAELGADHSRPNRLAPRRGLCSAGVYQMPNKYQREIEEILRNMEVDDQPQNLGDRMRAFNRPATRTRAPRTRMRLQMNSSETLLVVGAVLALIGAGLSYYFGLAVIGLNAIITGLFGTAGLICIIFGLGVGWRDRFGHRPAPGWRGQPDTPSDQPRRLFGPFRAIATQFRIMRLKWRYRRSPPSN